MNKTVFITGVSSGIGFGLASHYLDQGWQVYGVSRRTPAGLLKRDNFLFQPLDLLDVPATMLQVPALLEKVEHLELVVLNAGVLGQVADMKDVAIDDIKQTMNINLWSNKTLLDTLIQLPARLSQIVAISSGAAVNGNRGWNGYSISKAALNMLIQLYARENPQIHFAAVAPGLVDTAMQELLCSMTDQVAQFPSLGVLQSKRGGPEMPAPLDFGPILAQFLSGLPSQIESGQFVDIRNQLPNND